ncbi:MAG: hypothetical protein RJA49_1117 [Actinomycetota bacterium]
MLVVDGDDGSSDEALIDRLWMGTPPTNASFSLRNQVTALRRLLDRDAIIRTAGGYRLDRRRHPTDFDVFAGLFTTASAAAESGDVGAALDLLELAFGLVRGPALADVRHESWAVRFAGAADEQVLGAEDLWARLVLDAGNASEHLARLRVLAEQQPAREHRWGHLIAAHSRNGQRAAALRAAHDARRALAAVGLRVGPMILDAEQDALASAPTVLSPRGLPRLLARRVGPCVGRAAALQAVSSSARVVVVHGGPGVGTTRLLAEHASSAETTGATVLVARADGVVDEPRFVAALAHELVAAADRSTIDPDLRPLLEGTDDDVVPTDPATSSALPRRALQQLLDDLALVGALELIVDDAHLMSRDERRLIRQLVESAPVGVRFVLGGRSADAVGAAWWLDVVPAGPDAVVELRPLGRDDVHHLVRSAGVPDADVDAVVEAVWAASGGLPLVASRVLEEWTRTGRFDPDGSRWGPALEQALGEMSDDVRQVFVALAVLDRPIDEVVLRAAVGCAAPAADAALEHLHRRHLVERADGRVRVADEAYATIARAAAPAGTRERLRRRLIDDVGAGEREPGLVFGLLLEDGDGRPDRTARLDEAFIRVAGDLLAAGADGSALDAARRYVAVAGGGDGGRRSVRARLTAASLMLSSSDTAANGIALLAVAEEQARALDDAELITDAVLARGPVDTGGRHSRRTATEAESLVDRLPIADVPRRVQLLCWAAHHRVNAGDLEPAERLLAGADALSRSSPDPAWRALVLGVRVQAQLSAQGSPSGAMDAQAALEGWATLTGSLTADGAARLLAVSGAFGSGSLTEVELAAARILEISRVLPRSDLCWFPSATAAAVALARGDVDVAGQAMETTVGLGRSLGVSGAGPVGAAHFLLMSMLTGSLGSLAALLESAAAGERPPVERLAVFALASVHVGEVGRAAAAADALADRGTLLAGVGVSWPLVAMACAEVAWATQHGRLADLLWLELRRWSGWGLNMNGVAYVGAADTWLGLAAAASGRPTVAVELLAAGASQDERRGAGWWSSRARALLADVGG